MHYNHILPQVNLVIDYLMSRSFDISNGSINFPGEFAEGYAFLQGRIYGSLSGQFYDEEEIQPRMPKKLLEVDNRQVNFVAGRGDAELCLAFMNASDRKLKQVTFQLNPERFHGMKNSSLEARLAGQSTATRTNQSHGGRGTIQLSPKGITAISISGAKPRVQFQDRIK